MAQRGQALILDLGADTHRGVRAPSQPPLRQARGKSRNTPWRSMQSRFARAHSIGCGRGGSFARSHQLESRVIE